MEMLIPILAILGTFGMPAAIVITALVVQGRLQRQRLEMLMAERRLLIEKGVTDLPPLDLSDPRRGSRRYSTLAWGMVLVAVGLGVSLAGYLGGEGVHGHETAGPVLGFLGLALIGIHFAVRAYERADQRREEASQLLEQYPPVDDQKPFDDAK